MDLKLINMHGADSGTVALNEAVFAREYNEALIHEKTMETKRYGAGSCGDGVFSSLAWWW
jgi:hypothetical protein